MASVPYFPVGKLDAATRLADAKRFLAGADWKTVLFRSTSKSASGEPRYRMRVFAKGCPLHALREVHALLAGQTSVTDPVVDGVVKTGTWYHRTAVWARDAQTSESGDPTMTIIREFSDGPVTETDTVDDGCGGKTTIRFVWDASEVETLAGLVDADGDPYIVDGIMRQGTDVKIGGVNRDQETGLFSYYVTVTERKTKHLGEYAVTEDAFSYDYEETWSGLLGDIGTLRWTDGGTGPLPEDPLSQNPGTTLQVQYTRNQDDCSLNAQERKRKAKPDITASTGCSRDLFSERDSENISGAAAALGHAPAAANGRTYQHQSKLRPDGWYDTARDSQLELSVTQAEVSDETDLFSSTQSVTDRAQSADPAPASAGGGIIRSVQKSKTPGNRKNNRVVTRVEKPVTEAVRQVSGDLFQSSVDQEHANQADPGDGATGVVSPGLIKSRTRRKTPGGLVTYSDRTQTEREVLEARLSKRATIFETHDTKTDANSDGAASASAGGGLIVSVSTDKTPGGKKAVTTDTLVEKPVISAKVSKRKTIFETRETKVDVNSAGTAYASASGGTIISVNTDKTPGGKDNVTRDTVVETPVSSAEVSVTKTPGSVRTRTAHKNQTVALALAAGEFGTVQTSKTPGGLLDTAKESAADTLGESLSTAYSDNFLMRDYMRQDVVATEGPAGATLVGRVLTELSFRRTDGGGWVRETRTRTAPAAKQYTLTDTLTRNGAGILLNRVDSHTKVVLFLYSDVAAVREVAEAFFAPYALPFSINVGTMVDSWLYFSYSRNMGFGLRPDEFGLWSGTLTLSVELVNKMQYTSEAAPA